MIERHEISQPKKPKESVLPRWFDAYVRANKKFALIPTAIDACAGLEILRSIISREVSWGRLAHSKLSQAQQENVEEVMTRMHRAFHIPLVGASQSQKDHGMTRDMLKHFVHHHKRPLQTDAYSAHHDETHVVVHPKVMQDTWRGTVGETIRAAVVFGQVMGFANPHMQSFNVHTTPRSEFLRRPMVYALDHGYHNSENAQSLNALIRLYEAANAWGYSEKGLEIAKLHRNKFNLSKPHSKTPFEVTDELRQFNLGLQAALYDEVGRLRSDGMINTGINMQPFVEEMVKHGRLT